MLRYVKEVVMAIQNFLSGGYYGKLGDTVGQRWKNKRTIRAYVIPSNPRTEKQQKNRGNFGQCTAKAQIALQMNYNTTLFNSTSSSAWNERMSTARNLQKDGEQNLDLIPLYPYSYAPTYLITDIYDFKKADETFYTASVGGTLPSVDRSMSILIQTQNPTTSEVYDEFLFRADFIAGEKPYIKIYNANINLSGYKLKARIVSNDDPTPTDICVSREVEVKGKTIEVIYLDLSSPTVTRENNVVSIATKTAFETATKTMTGAKITVVKGGQYVVEEPLAVDVVDKDGFFAIQITTDNDEDINKAFFGTDCDLSFTDFALETDRKVFRINDNRLQITEDNPTYTISKYAVDEPTDDTIQAAFHYDEGLALIGAFSGAVLCDAYVATYVDTVDCFCLATSKNGKTTFKVMTMTEVFPAKSTTCQMHFAGKTVELLGVKYSFEAFNSNYSNKKTFVDLTDKQIFDSVEGGEVVANVTVDGSGNVTSVADALLDVVTIKLADDTVSSIEINNCQNLKLTFTAGGKTYSSTRLSAENNCINSGDPEYDIKHTMNLGFIYGESPDYDEQQIINSFTLSKADESADSFINGADLPYPIKINPNFTFNG